MAGVRGARRGATALRAVAAAALFAATLAACGDDVPPLPAELRRLEQQEAGCIACHDGRREPALDPSVVATPRGHPSVATILRRMSDPERSRLAAPERVGRKR